MTMKGLKHSKETKKKISNSKKGVKYKKEVLERRINFMKKNRKGKYIFCPICKEKFYIFPCEDKTNKRRYCSKKCQYISQKGKSVRKSKEVPVEVREKIRNTLKGHKVSEDTRKKISEKNKGKKQSEEQKKRTSLRLKEDYKKGIRKSFFKELKGERHHNWKGGITSINEKIRKSLEYQLWRKAVFERDNYTCVFCGARSGKGKKVVIHADHIKPFALFPELRFAIDNGRTLCIDCHRKTNTYGGKQKDETK